MEVGYKTRVVRDVDDIVKILEEEAKDNWEFAAYINPKECYKYDGTGRLILKRSSGYKVESWLKSFDTRSNIT